MKKICTLVFVFLTLLSVSGLAQNGKQNMEVMRERLRDSLKLSNVQVDSVISIRQQFQPQIRNIMKDQSLSKDQKKDKVKPIKQEMIARLRKMLTNEQFQKLEQMEQEMKNKNANKGE